MSIRDKHENPLLKTEVLSPQDSLESSLFKCPSKAQRSGKYVTFNLTELSPFWLVISCPAN